ncbi:anaphase-promoting complex, cyclosome, subunit 4-domain-containing protein [Hygrophoropsis aurantiaca]|uniref:Anaphase-promoting complex, cyclosome, subunit 4-domain-containing protein n=1 Tax=Hygrophoropsis aurantiaca TaxID=72124 RepID=A0ACB8AD40_9AGAM|nr:anaphase-promoting complex, cyclosome, subunit 4-domain-containing protein [Hygrophoropsis aurantiaca]
MEQNAFASLAVLQLSTACRLLASACCPDKDLVALVSRLGGRDKLSLWKMQGGKKWEVDVGTDDRATEEIVGLAWSSSGQTIAVAHDPPRVTLHSVQDGKVERLLPITPPITLETKTIRITGIWWFSGQIDTPYDSIPDIFKRNAITTGSALSILKTLPLLDHLHEGDQKLTATDLFAFQGTQVKHISQPSTPTVISEWPSLILEPSLASITSSHQAEDNFGNSPKEHSDETRFSEDVNSVLVAIDDLGNAHCFLDGSYHLGYFESAPAFPTTALYKDPKLPIFFMHPQESLYDAMGAGIKPVSVELPLLATPKVRNLAKLSSTARELVGYTLRVIKDMRDTWFGSDTVTGAREVGPKWANSLETKLRNSFGQQEPNVVLDLTCLLLTGHSSDGLEDFFGSSEQMTERAFQKWDSSLTDSLIKLRDFSTTRLVPALQRVHIILEEIRGWSYMSHYALFQVEAEEINVCLSLAQRAIFIASWLAFQANRELGTFKHFLAFLKHEAATANPTAERTVPEYDVLEVNNYLMSGLVASDIDGWFLGPIPLFDPASLGIPGQNQMLDDILLQTQVALHDPLQTTWKANITSAQFSDMDRNLDALVQKLASTCQQIFSRASQAAARSAVTATDGGAILPQVAAGRPTSEAGDQSFVRQRIIGDKNAPDGFVQYLAIRMSSDLRSFLCLVRTPYGKYAPGVPLHVDVGLLECSAVGYHGEQSVELNVLDADFFDDEYLVIIYNVKNSEGPMFIATVNYRDLEYRELQSEGYVNAPVRKEIVTYVVQRWNEGHFPSASIPIKRCRQLIACKNGPVSLAMNGRIGRRVVCILDGSGGTMEILDMEGDEEMEGDDEAEMESFGA